MHFHVFPLIRSDGTRVITQRTGMRFLSRMYPAVQYEFLLRTKTLPIYLTIHVMTFMLFYFCMYFFMFIKMLC